MDSFEAAYWVKIGQVQVEFALDLCLAQLTNHFFRFQWAVIRSLALEILLGILSFN